MPQIKIFNYFCLTTKRKTHDMAKEINLTEQLKHYFGFDKFKGDQEDIIQPAEENLSVTSFPRC